MPEREYQPTNNEDVEFLNTEILNLAPHELVDRFISLQEEGKLEDFLRQALSNESLIAQISYWEKWLKKDHRKLVERIVQEKKDLYDSKQESGLPLRLEQRYSSDDLKLIMQNIVAIQITFGCSKGCPFCAFDAMPGIREHIPYSQLAHMFEQYGKYIGSKKPKLYWASEPSDYIDELEDKTYEDVHQLAVEYAGYSPHITSRETSDEDWLTFLNAKGSFPRVSLYGYNAEKKQEIKKKLGKNIETVGEDGSHRENIGRSYDAMRREDDDINTIANNRGLLLTPRGLYNICEIRKSKKHPQGIIVVPLETIEGGEVNVEDNLEEVLRRNIIIYPNEPVHLRPQYSKEIDIAMYIRNRDQIHNIHFSPVSGKITKSELITVDDFEGYLQSEKEEKYITWYRIIRDSLNGIFEKAVKDGTVLFDDNIDPSIHQSIINHLRSIDIIPFINKADLAVFDIERDGVFYDVSLYIDGIGKINLWINYIPSTKFTSVYLY